MSSVILSNAELTIKVAGLSGDHEKLRTDQFNLRNELIPIALETRTLIKQLAWLVCGSIGISIGFWIWFSLYVATR